MNIHEVTSQGHAERIGPFKVNKSWGVKGDGEKSNLFILIEDQSGKGAMKVWGQAGHLLKEGSLYTLTASGPRSSIKLEENQGKSLIVCNGCSVHEGDAVASCSQPEVSAPTIQPQAAQEANTPERTRKMLARMAQITMEYHNFLLAVGFSPTDALEISKTGVHNVALWWFGDKQA